MLAGRHARPPGARSLIRWSVGAVTVVAAAAGIGMFGHGRSQKPRVVMQETPFNKQVLQLCPTADTVYRVLPWLFNGHLETIFAAFFRRSPGLEKSYVREMLKTADGGTVTLDFEPKQEGVDGVQGLPNDAPVLILLPGLTGGSHDTYMQHMVLQTRNAGIRAIVFNGRLVVKTIREWYPNSTLLACGWSLGGCLPIDNHASNFHPLTKKSSTAANILVRYLGEEGAHTPIAAAASLCNPFDLVVSDRNFQTGFNRIYDYNLARGLRNFYRQHQHLFKEDPLGKGFNPEAAANASTIRAFDDAITRVSFDWPSVDAYYAGSSSSLSVPDVGIPLLCVQAEDDPIAPITATPETELRANPNCILVVTPAGGHLGWCSGDNAPLGAPWPDKLVIEYFCAVMKLQADGRPGPAVAVGQQLESAPA